MRLRFIQGLIAGTHRVTDWRPSSNEYDWLGGGIYFWEFGPERARQWAKEDGEVIGALIQLGNCFDLTDPGYESLLKATFDTLSKNTNRKEKRFQTTRPQKGFRESLIGLF
ncbi:MAG: hypothetical protein R3C05_11845 [Pirellulaceae bacterium]